MSLENILIKINPDLPKMYRNFVLDMKELLEMVPKRGMILDVGCGTGFITRDIAERNKAVKILAIDTDSASIKQAKKYNQRPNIDFKDVPIEKVSGRFDCILFIDVIHHLNSKKQREMLQRGYRMLKRNGYILIKDVDKSKKSVILNTFLDKYVSLCKVYNIKTADELKAMAPKNSTIKDFHVKTWHMFPHVYFKIVKSGN